MFVLIFFFFFESMQVTFIIIEISITMIIIQLINNY